MDPAASEPRRPRQRRADLRRLAAGVALLVGVAVAFGWTLRVLRERAAARAALPLTAGRVVVPGLERSVRVDRDRHGVPHIDASSERDAVLALGFVQAQDRLAQLLWLRRQARGTTAGVLGSEGLAADRFARLIDFRGLADAQWPQLEPGTRRVLEAFAAGVNARIERVRRGDAAPPARLAEQRLEIEPWRPQDSLALFKLFSWGLSNSIEASLVLSDVVAKVGAGSAGRFFPPRAPELRPGGQTTARSPRFARPARWVEEGALALRRGLGLAGSGVGSSAFVLGGAHAEGGHPLLVADTHLEPTVPAALYLAHLRAPGIDVAGAALAGIPVFWWGRNAHLAWACVNAGVVVTDLYAEAVRPDGSYHDGRRWRPAEERIEVIRVDGGDDVRLRIRRTGHGPILPAGEADPEAALALSWTGARIRQPSGIASLWEVAHAEDGEGVRRALRRHHDPVIVVAWAEALGGAGLQLAGWIPRRSLASQLLPLPGRARWYDWRKPVPFEALTARRLEAGRGFLVAADQRFEVSEEEPPPDALWRSGARAARLTRLLEERAAAGAVDLRDVAALEGDVTLDHSLQVLRRARALLGESPLGEEAAELERLLRRWDGRASADSTGSAVYHVFLQRLAQSLFSPRLGAGLFERYLAIPAVDLESLVLGVLDDAVAEGDGEGWPEPEFVRQALRDSLREAWLELSFRLGSDPRQWTWGRIHPLRFRSPSGGDGLGPFPYGGAPHAVQIADYAPSHPFDVRVAAVARFAIDAGSLDVALVALAPGQSEHPGDPQFDEGLARWLGGDLALLTTRRLEIEDRSVAQLVLKPVR